MHYYGIDSFGGRRGVKQSSVSHVSHRPPLLTLIDLVVVIVVVAHVLEHDIAPSKRGAQVEELRAQV